MLTDLQKQFIKNCRDRITYHKRKVLLTEWILGGLIIFLSLIFLVLLAIAIQ